MDAQERGSNETRSVRALCMVLIYKGSRGACKAEFPAKTLVAVFPESPVSAPHMFDARRASDACPRKKRVKLTPFLRERRNSAFFASFQSISIFFGKTCQGSLPLRR